MRTIRKIVTGMLAKTITTVKSGRVSNCMSIQRPMPSATIITTSVTQPIEPSIPAIARGIPASRGSGASPDRSLRIVSQSHSRPDSGPFLDKSVKNIGYRLGRNSVGKSANNSTELLEQASSRANAPIQPRCADDADNQYQDGACCQRYRVRAWNRNWFVIVFGSI